MITVFRSREGKRGAHKETKDTMGMQLHVVWSTVCDWYWELPGIS
jgi:hypothetical protein